MKDLTSPRSRIRSAILRIIRSLKLSYPLNLTLFVLLFKRFPNFKRTRYINDRLFEIKAFESNDILRAFTSDKEYTKIFARGVLGKEYSVPTLAILKSNKDIDNFKHSGKVVAKPSHLSQDVLFIEGIPDKDQIIRMKKWLKLNFSDYSLENNYRYLEPKIIVEPFLDFGSGVPIDYKIYTYNGKVHVIEVISGRFGDKNYGFYTPDWKMANIEVLPTTRNTMIPYEKPARLKDMIEISEKLSVHFDLVRIDMYSDAADILYLGEISHVTASVRKVYLPVESERYYIDGIPPEGIKG